MKVYGAVINSKTKEELDFDGISLEEAKAKLKTLSGTVYGLHWDISRSIGPLAGGLILTSFGGEVIFYALAVCLLTAGLSLTYTIEKLEHKVIRKVNRL